MATAATARSDTDRTADRTPLLSVRDLVTTFDARDAIVHAVNGISFDVGRGEVLAVVGESGSGKSVSMLSIVGLLPTPPARIRGEARFDGRDLLALPSRELRAIRGRDIGMVFQDPMSSLNPVMPVGRQIQEVLELHLRLGRTASRARALDLLKRVGIPAADERIDDFPHQFSGGMRQRVMIAMALACDPKLLIADEPTTALDVTIQAQIVALVRDLQAELGMSVIWITHDLGVVATIADRVVVMYGGRILEEGGVDRIYGAPRHPYTAGLLRSVPRLTTSVTDRLAEIPGTPPEMTSDPMACAFAARCPMAHTDCVAVRPPLAPTELASHRSACLHWPEMVARDPFPIVASARTDPTVDGGDALLRVRDLEVHFPVRRGWRGKQVGLVRAVDGVSLDLARGRTLGLVGESGCGKTTLGRSVLRLVEPTGGRVEVGGTAVSSLGKAELRRFRPRMQMVFQDPGAAINPGMRIVDVVAEPLRVQGVVARRNERTRVGELLETVGLRPASMDRYPHEFSGGQRQRIVIARSLALEPELLVCDEPVSSLDVSVQAQIVNLLSRLQRERGLAYLFIAHDLAVVRQISDRVAVMYLGKIVEEGDRSQIYSQPLHPYTQALLRSAPVPDPATAATRREPAITGDLPSPSAPPAGCRFNTRCPIAQRGLCDVEEPPLRELAPGQLVACHLATSPGAQGVAPVHGVPVDA
jgi:peptide/nickel transport system ATP-binding protein